MLPNQVAHSAPDSKPDSKKEQSVRFCWHVITSEYPPQPGGVSDYTYGVAVGLAAEGDQVHVWCPAYLSAQPQAEGVVVHRELGAITPTKLRRVGQQLDRFPAPRRILVQWVPHGFGYRSMNVQFCLWILGRSLFHRDHVEIMVHEAFLAFWEGTWKQDLAAAIHRLMTSILLQAARGVWVSTPKWIDTWKPYAFGRRIPFRWLPIPSNVAVIHDPIGISAIHKRYAAGGILLGHFGTFGSFITNLLRHMLPPLLTENQDLSLLLIGPGSESFRNEMVQLRPDIGSRISAVGYLAASDPELSRHISACDLMIQPYADGVTSRRSTIMAALSHALPTITTSGRLTEPFWSESQAVGLHPADDMLCFRELVRSLTEDGDQRKRLGERGRTLYEERFEMSRTIGALRGDYNPIAAPLNLGDEPTERSPLPLRSKEFPKR